MISEDCGSVPGQAWPEKGDKLFASGDDWWNNACLKHGHCDWELYISGYKRAGDVLVHHIDDTGRDQDFLVFPTVFVYRQHLELRLKKLIGDCRSLLDESSGIPPGHELSNLWQDCRPLLEKLEPKAEKEGFEAIGEVIQQFCELDPSSQSFRYPVDTRGANSLPSKQKHINVRNLSGVMGKLSDCLEDAALTVQVALDDKEAAASAHG